MVRSLRIRSALISIAVVLFVLMAGSPSESVAADILLSWVDNSNNETGFRVERKTGTNGTYAQIATVGANTKSYSDTGLSAGTTYCYRVRAYNSAGNSAFTPEACKTTSAASSFNFALVHSGDKTVTRGQSVSNVITATLTSGSSQSVSFSTAGFPTGATASYTSSSSCAPTCSRTLTIATSSSTPTGTYPIRVIGSGGGVVKTITFNLAVTSGVVSGPSFQFALANSGNKSVTRGQSTSNVITATLVAGSTHAVSFSSSGLPAGATASYASSSSCSPTCSRTMNITTSTSTPAGTYQIMATVAGAGVTKTTSFSLTVTTGSGGGGGSSNMITVEAEAGVRTAPMTVRSDGAASGGKYVEVPEGSGDNYNDGTKGGPGQIRFTINISQAGTRRLWARTIAPNGGSDSFYVTRNGTLVREWLVPVSTTWKWNKVADVSLASGGTTLAFRQREAGTRLDQIILTTDANFNPNNGTVASAPGGSGGSSSTITMEAESGTLTGPMLVHTASAASGGRFVEVPDGNGNNYNDGSKGGPGQVSFSISVSRAGSYALWARILAANGNSDSFYVTRNGSLVKESSFWPSSPNWQWRKVADLTLSSGDINLAFRQREDGTKLDRISLSSDPNFDPT